MKIKEKYSVFSNLAYFGLFIYASLDSNNYVALLLLFILIGSASFHIAKPEGFTWWNKFYTLNSTQKLFFLIDNISVYMITVYLLVNFYHIGFSELPILIFVFAIFGLGIFFFKHKSNYDFYHGLWHLLSAGVIFLYIYHF